MIVILHKPRLIEPSFLAEGDHASVVGLVVAIPEILVVKPDGVGPVAIMVAHILFQNALEMAALKSAPGEFWDLHLGYDACEGLDFRDMKMLLHHGRKGQHGTEDEQNEGGLFFLHDNINLAKV